MADVNAITLKLESTLQQIGELNHRWVAWLKQNELAVLSADAGQLAEMEVGGQQLIHELSGMNLQRQQILEAAGQCGLQAGSLQSLARQLPEWNQGELRSTLVAAKRQLAEIRRLHVAVWVLISQRLGCVRDQRAIMMSGSLRNDVYLTGQHQDSGGQLLDASL